MIATQCDGDWEHGEGVTIETLDNPGWRVQIDVDGTAVDGQVYERTKLDRSERDWIHSWLDGSKWNTACGPLNLGEALGLFRRWVQGDG